jgi:uncharacterized protein (DUF433 family)/DNA-binding transcriptional MerR regulator
VGDAAALIGVSGQKIRAWIKGWPRTTTKGVIHNDLGWVDGRLAFSFVNLMELRFVAFFAAAGVNLREIRAIMAEARAELDRPHPFATNVVFRTDGAKIVAEIALRNGVSDLYDLKSKNFEMGIVVYQSLKEGVVYDPKGNALAWYPRRALAPNVIIHPKFAFGRPVLKERGIPTEAIADAMRAEGSADIVAEIFEIPKRQVHEAIAFEADIRRAA